MIELHKLVSTAAMAIICGSMISFGYDLRSTHALIGALIVAVGAMIAILYMLFLVIGMPKIVKDDQE